MPKLSIIIPAYNEEEAITSIIERTLEARKSILENMVVSQVEVIVVNDGSTDKTFEIASKFKEIKLINHERNLGYGAAIKTGFGHAQCDSGDLVAFLDADGTCDPNFLAALCRKLMDEGADIAIGSRMHRESHMPELRRLGNRLFASLLNFIGNTDKVTDSASGMRVIKWDALKRLYPLPDGLNFTPAMSCKAILDKNLKIVEEPMPYKERMGKSKLKFFKDGLRFLKVIFDVLLTYRPLRFFGTLGTFLILLGILYGVFPVEYYLKTKTLQEGMIYRLLTILVLIISGLTMITVGVVSERVVELLDGQKGEKTFFVSLTEWFFEPKRLIYLGFGLSCFGAVLNYKTIIQYLITGKIMAHWSYVVTGALFVLSGIQLFALGILERVVALLKEKKTFWENNR